MEVRVSVVEEVLHSLKLLDASSSNLLMNSEEGIVVTKSCTVGSKGKDWNDMDSLIGVAILASRDHETGLADFALQMIGPKNEQNPHRNDSSPQLGQPMLRLGRKS